MVLNVIFEYSGLIFAVGGMLLSIPPILALHVNHKKKTFWPLRATVPSTIIFWIFVLPMYSLMVNVQGFYTLATIGMISQSVVWTFLIIQALIYRVRWPQASTQLLKIIRSGKKL